MSQHDKLTSTCLFRKIGLAQISQAIFKGLVSQRQRKAGSIKPKLIAGEKQEEGQVFQARMRL
jgi:hypothetical protein